MKRFHFGLTAIIALLTMSFTAITNLKQSFSGKQKEGAGCYRLASVMIPPELPPYNGRNLELLDQMSWILEPTSTPFDPETECPVPISTVCCYLVEVDLFFEYYIVGVWYGEPEV